MVVDPSASPLIRVAAPSEYEQIGELTAAAYADVLTAGNDDPYRSVLLDAAGRARSGELVVAIDRRDAILGTVTVGRPGTAMAEIAHPYELEVRMLAVAPSYEGRGIGRALMQYVHDTAAAESLPKVVLSVIATNTRALDFYRSLGYARMPERDWLPRPDMPPLRVLRLTLNAQPS